MITGQKTFNGKDLSAIVYKIITERIIIPDSIFKPLLNRMFDRKPLNRLSIEEVHNIFGQIISASKSHTATVGFQTNSTVEI
jgi:hypothetical protein